ncbi:MAG: hypothetical protein E7231_04225 [Cellulosilyticum sp.]|nr:hypothetical protein [Cellulosilyticum sp.]
MIRQNMKLSERGFTLVEMCLAMILFFLLLEGLWGFYLQVYREQSQFNERLQLMNEASDIETFIRMCLREAETVKVKTIEGDIVENSLEENGLNQKDIIDQTLDKIEFTREIKVSSSNYKKKNCLLALYDTPKSQVDKGKYSLKYRVWEGAYLSSNTIGDCIETIQVTHYKNTNSIEFTCIIGKVGKENNRLLYTHTFTESLAYK